MSHESHCNQGHWQGSCKYGDEYCPALQNQKRTCDEVGFSHEKGIEAATEVISAEHAYHLSYDAVSKGIKAYLDASGMVMVPSKPTEGMIEAACDEVCLLEEKEARWAYEAMVRFHPNPFQTPEESREKK